MKNEKLLELFRSMDDNELVSVWNEFCYENNKGDDAIMDYGTLEEYISNDSVHGTIYWLNRFYFGSDEYSTNEGSANPNRNYFKFNAYGNIISFDYIYNSYTKEFNYMDIDELIDYIIENEDSLYNDDIQEILDNE